MINIGETRLPGKDNLAGIVDPGETRLPESNISSDNRENEALHPGDSLAGSYIVNTPLGESGKQSDVYLAKKAGHPCVIKLYHSGWHPSEKMQEFLSGHSHPNLARIIESGDYQGRHYEIYEYYFEGTLEQQKQCAPALIQKVIVPSINEGLNTLHENGIVHCDIKPSNLFLSNDGTRVVIGDYGISGYVGNEGKYIDKIRGTPEYAPRIISFFGSASMSPAYDYGSLGLVLCRLYTGHSLFGEMTIDEIARTWERGLVIPSQIDGRIRELIQGLLVEDETERWGFKQVKRWCEGEYMRSVDRNIYRKKKAEGKALRPLIFGRFDGQTFSVSTLHQLAVAIRKYWEHSARLLKRKELGDFLQQFSSDLAISARELAFLRDPDEAVFRLLYSVEKSDIIYFRGKDFGRLEDFLTRLNSSDDPDIIAFVTSGMFTYYLALCGADSAQIDALDRIIQKDGLNDLATIRTLCYSLKEQKDLTVEGNSVSTLNDFVDVIAKKTTAEISGLLESSDVIAWLYSMGFQQEIIKMSALQEGVS